jgi:U3 small nucleolar RNA-associated protein 7
LKELLGVQNAQSVFNLNLEDFGPYKSLDFSRNGRYMMMGSRKGHVAMMDWKNKDLVCEFQTK